MNNIDWVFKLLDCAAPYGLEDECVTSAMEALSDGSASTIKEACLIGMKEWDCIPDDINLWDENS